MQKFKLEKKDPNTKEYTVSQYMKAGEKGAGVSLVVGYTASEMREIVTENQNGKNNSITFPEFEIMFTEQNLRDMLNQIQIFKLQNP